MSIEIHPATKSATDIIRPPLTDTDLRQRTILSASVSMDTCDFKTNFQYN